MDTIVSLSKASYTYGSKGDYTNLEDITLAIRAYTEDNFYMTQSAEVAEQFLRRNWPLMSYVPGFRSTSTRSSLYSERSSDIKQFAYPSIVSKLLEESSSSSGTYCSKLRTISIVSAPVHTMPVVATYRVNLLCKIQLVDRALEEGALSMDKLRKRFVSAIFLLKAEEENLRVDFQDIEKSREAFHQVITENTDTKSGLVMKDKFERCLESEIGIMSRKWRKMRLNLKNLQLEYNRIKSQQYRKLELREQLHAVDIDKLLIENQEKQNLLKQKTKILHNLKKEIGRKGQQLITQKSNKNGVISNLKNTTNELKQKVSKYSEMEIMEEQNMNRLQVAERVLDNVKRMQETFTSPKAQDYLELEVTVGKLKKERDNWEKRCFNDEQTIAFLNHQIKQILSHSSQKPPSKYKTSRY